MRLLYKGLYIQGDSGEINVLGGDSVGRCEKKLCELMFNFE